MEEKNIKRERRKEQRVIGTTEYSELMKETVAKSMIINELEKEIERLKFENKRLSEMINNLIAKRLSDIK